MTVCRHGDRTPNVPLVCTFYPLGLTSGVFIVSGTGGLGGEQVCRLFEPLSLPAGSDEVTLVHTLCCK